MKCSRLFAVAASASASPHIAAVVVYIISKAPYSGSIYFLFLV